MERINRRGTCGLIKFGRNRGRSKENSLNFEEWDVYRLSSETRNIEF